MITLTAVLALLGLTWVARQLWKRALRVAARLAEAKPVTVSIAPSKS